MKCNLLIEKLENWTKGLFNNYHQIPLVIAEMIQITKFGGVGEEFVFHLSLKKKISIHFKTYY